MADQPPDKNPFAFHIQGNLIAGILTIIPLVVVWLVFQFLLDTLESAGHPMAAALADFIIGLAPGAQPWLEDRTVQWLIGVLVALLILYAIGAIATRVIGIQLIGLFEKLIARIPVVQSVYSAAKKLVGVLQQHPEGGSRVVLIEFPHPGLKTIGFVMRTFHDATTGEELAAVFVPTSPNPTSGYLEIAPLEKLTATNMTMDQAMSMVVSGGATAPDSLSLTPAKPKP
ncbi:MAG TPA: DUF502 domain-containing protein [Rhizomicrobium sp.]|jgi:uncharacterized membrane protein|nr:DUF502 domain-containing protein [Rhizomicrobium sp.]